MVRPSSLLVLLLLKTDSILSLFRHGHYSLRWILASPAQICEFNAEKTFIHIPKYAKIKTLTISPPRLCSYVYLLCLRQRGGWGNIPLYLTLQDKGWERPGYKGLTYCHILTFTFNLNIKISFIFNTSEITSILFSLIKNPYLHVRDHLRSNCKIERSFPKFSWSLLVYLHFFHSVILSYNCQPPPLSNCDQSSYFGLSNSARITFGRY